ncbi:5-oxoprolinase subunit PxpB [Erwinia tasmaniensis]|uniref:Allophanate hydrolase subunit 1 n=1 Tax=Erwinia tasmaniensis (strain DSM 17950 / CFBP 7177 / CIP 109463 / NCPPB 4357 / Et1/99) TaxID=465817 RepID=B2VBP6_ERWT9|nr:5-oxoprolinase subunit PxpB [Erwinia tasmaniensis]CAO97362.1 Putative allophanate hydrolase subunit 1 [Erwinia tasmaniensis Et1/99]
MQQARCYLLGERAVVLELDPPISLASQQRIWGLAQCLRDCREALEIIPGMNNITVLLRDPQQDAQSAVEWLQQHWAESEALELASRTIDIPVIYGGHYGPDLDEVARHSDMSASQVVACHAAMDYVVYFIGFQPGFPYLGGLDQRLHTPRRAEPRVRVPAGSVGIGGSQTGVYPVDAPGGWQLIGQTKTPLFTPAQEPPVLLRPGDRVRFVPQKEGIC